MDSPALVEDRSANANADLPRGIRGSRKARVILLAGSYPTDAHPWCGVPVEERTRALVGSGKAIVNVVAPVPWFPFRREHFRDRLPRTRVPVRERRFGIPIEHPRYLLPPRLGRSMAAASMARVVLSGLRQRLVRGADFDLIEADGFYPEGLAAVALGHALGKPVVMIARGADAALLERHAALRLRVLQATAGVSAVIAVSHALHDKLLSLGFNAAATRALRDGVDLGRFRMSGHNTTKAKFRLSGTIWLEVGALTAPRRVELAIGALASVHDATLLIVGEGPSEARLRNLAVRLGVDSRMHFIGGVAHNQLPRYYNAADALLHTSSGEDIPNSVLECLACGTPVVALPSAGAKEILTSADAGEIAATTSAADLAAAWIRLRSRLPARADTRTFAETFGWDDTIESLGDLYATLRTRGAGAPKLAPTA